MQISLLKNKLMTVFHHEFDLSAQQAPTPPPPPPGPSLRKLAPESLSWEIKDD